MAGESLDFTRGREGPEDRKELEEMLEGAGTEVITPLEPILRRLEASRIVLPDIERDLNDQNIKGGMRERNLQTLSRIINDLTEDALTVEGMHNDKLADEIRVLLSEAEGIRKKHLQ